MYWLLVFSSITACVTNSDTTCTSCVKQSNDTMLCVWCYEDLACKQWTRTMPCSNKSDISFGGQQCECRPGIAQSCSSCTKKHNCVWLQDSEIEVTATITDGPNYITTVLSVNSGDSCWAGDLFSGPTYTDWTLEGQHLKIHAHLHGSVWSWGQCNISGVWMVIIIFLIVFVSLLIFSFVFKMMMDRRKMRREIDQKVDEPLLLVQPTDRVEYDETSVGQERN